MNAIFKREFEDVTSKRADYRLIPLTQGKNAIVDADDYERLSAHKWRVNKNSGGYYAVRNAGGKVIAMHRQIIEIPPGLICDHINHNTLDNRKANLRACTHSQNIQNSLPRAGGTSRYKGVYWCKRLRKWLASIRCSGRKIYIGAYDYEQDAAIAYDDMAIELFGEFACLNYQYRPEIRMWLDQSRLWGGEIINP